MPTVPTFAVRETDVSRHKGETSGAPGQQMLEMSVSRTANVGTVGINGIIIIRFISKSCTLARLFRDHVDLDMLSGFEVIEDLKRNPFVGRRHFLWHFQPFSFKNRNNKFIVCIPSINAIRKVEVC